MIRYSLVCARSHGFEAWFRDSAAFDDLNREAQLACPQCGSSDVRKALMSPAIRRGVKFRDPAQTPSSAADVPVPAVVALEPVSIEEDKARQIRALAREIHARVKANAENVGPAFPDEARKIHEGDEPPRSIYGTATADEVRSLIDDGVGIVPLPPLPDERN